MADDDSVLADEMRSRLQEIYIYYGFSWFAQPVREGSLPIRALTCPRERRMCSLD